MAFCSKRVHLIPGMALILKAGLKPDGVHRNVAQVGTCLGLIQKARRGSALLLSPWQSRDREDEKGDLSDGSRYGQSSCTTSEQK